MNNVRNNLIKCLFEFTEEVNISEIESFVEIIEDACVVMVEEEAHIIDALMNWYRNNKCVSNDEIYYLGKDRHFNTLESDNVAELLRGNFHIHMGIEVASSSGKDIWEGVAEFKFGRLNDLTVFNHEDDREVVFVAKGRKIREMTRISIPTPGDPHSSGTRYSYKYY